MEPKTVGWGAVTVDILVPEDKTVACGATSLAEVCETFTGTARRADVTWFLKKIV